jgi:acetyltransferase-like isoleucine patch superfamily enzyme
MKEERRARAKGDFWVRLRSTLFVVPASIAPHKRLRTYFHRLRGVDIGRNVEIGYGCLLGGVNPSRIHLADNVVITARTVILDHDNAYYYTFNREVVCGDVYIREGSFIGIGCVIYPGVEIGPRAVVGALSFVKSDIPPFCVAAGQPARVVKEMRPANQPAGTLAGSRATVPV